MNEPATGAETEANANLSLIDNTSRTALLHAIARDSTLSEATTHLASQHVLITACADASREPSGQAAFLTAVTLAARAGLRVAVMTGDPDAIVAAGPYRGARFGQAATELAGQLLVAGVEPIAVLRVGNPMTQTASGTSVRPGLDLQITWDGWLAQASPGPQRLDERPGCRLAPIAAAALAVSEVFLHLSRHLDAGWRTVGLSLWNPSGLKQWDGIGPAIRRLPTQWEVVGLGHLGQAAAWALSHLPYEAGTWEVWLTDDDLAAGANISTGVFTRKEDADPVDNWPARPKTRLVAAALEHAGARTRLIECRLSPAERWDPRRPSVALLGVDDIVIRRRLSEIGWPLCMDAGLGATPSSYNSMAVYALDDVLNSANLSAWRQDRQADDPDTSGAVFVGLRGEGIDECGVVMLAGRAVAAAFVGMIAACLSISEPLRRLHAGPLLSSVGLSLEDGNPVCGPRLAGDPMTTLPYLTIGAGTPVTSRSGFEES